MIKLREIFNKKNAEGLILGGGLTTCLTAGLAQSGGFLILAAAVIGGAVGGTILGGMLARWYQKSEENNKKQIEDGKAQIRELLKDVPTAQKP